MSEKNPGAPVGPEALAAIGRMSEEELISHNEALRTVQLSLANAALLEALKANLWLTGSSCMAALAAGLAVAQFIAPGDRLAIAAGLLITASACLAGWWWRRSRGLGALEYGIDIEPARDALAEEANRRGIKL